MGTASVVAGNPGGKRSEARDEEAEEETAGMVQPGGDSG